MPYYEYQCPKGHLFSELKPIGTAQVPCWMCLQRGSPAPDEPIVYADRILSATRTTFKHADRTSKI